MKKRYSFEQLLILSILLFGCEKFKSVELNTGCFDEFPTSGYLSGESGKVQAATTGDQANLIIMEKSDGSTSLIFACNLPPQYQKQGLEIKFDADIKNIPAMICDTLPNDSIHCITLDILGTPVTLTSLKVKD